MILSCMERKNNLYGRSLIKHPSLRRMIPNLANLVEDNNL